jgi:Tol biopolymer transport system component
MRFHISKGVHAIALSLIAVLWVGSACGEPLRAVSVRGSVPAPVAGDGDSCGPILSANGRFIIFSSTAEDLARGTNGLPLPQVWPRPMNVFVRDRLSQTTALVSVNAAGTGGGNSNSFAAGISDDGRYALFQSVATNLFPGDTNRLSDVFVRDLAAGTNILINQGITGRGHYGSRSPVITPDGRYVAFICDVTNYPRTAVFLGNVFRRDLWSNTTTLVSVDAKSSLIYSDHPVAFASSESPLISTDGRYVAFYSTATNLVATVTNVGEIYLRDIDGATTVWVSGYARAALPTQGPCFGHALSADGQYVAYEASLTDPAGTLRVAAVLRYNLATGLTDLISTNAYFPNQAPEERHCLDMSRDGRYVAFVGNTNGNTGVTTCVWVWDALTGETVLASGDLDDAVTDGTFCSCPVLSGGGRLLAFLSTATNLVTQALPPGSHLFVRDLETQTTSAIDTGAGGRESTLVETMVPQVSDDGQFVAFESADAAFVPGDNNRATDVFMWDMVLESMELISVADTNGPLSRTPNASSTLALGGVSADGRYVTFVSEASDLVPGDTNGVADIFVRDVWSGTNILVSVGTNGSAADGYSMDPVISGNGRFVAFTSRADNLVPGDTNSAFDVFVRDLVLGETRLASVSTNGVDPGDRASYSPAISDDGRFVMYRSLALNLGAYSPVQGLEIAIARDMQLETNYAFRTAFNSPTPRFADGGRYVSYINYGSPVGLLIWDNQLGAIIYTNRVGPDSVLSADGNRLASVEYGSSKLSVFDRAAKTNWTTPIILTTSLAKVRFSRDGRFLACMASGVRYRTVYLLDCVAMTNTIAGLADPSRGSAVATSDSPDISADGRFVAFRSVATNIVSGVTNVIPGIFVYDRIQNSTMLLSLGATSGLPANDRSLRPVFSADGGTLVFASWASDLVENDFNHGCDIVAYHIFGAGEIPVFSTTVRRPATGPGVLLTWPVVLGKTYRVEFKTGLDDPNWQELTGVTFVGNQGVLTDSAAAGQARFYRVVAY